MPLNQISSCAAVFAGHCLQLLQVASNCGQSNMFDIFARCFFLRVEGNGKNLVCYRLLLVASSCALKATGKPRVLQTLARCFFLRVEGNGKTSCAIDPRNSFQLLSMKFLHGPIRLPLNTMVRIQNSASRPALCCASTSRWSATQWAV